MSRHPYTYSCDFIRALAGYNEHGTILSRSDASQIRQGIAKVIGMDDEKLAEILSLAEQAKTDTDYEDQTKAYLRELGISHG